MEEPKKSKVAKFMHDFKGLGSDTVDTWVFDWLADMIRSCNQTMDTHLIILGIGKSTRLLRIRNDFSPVDEYQKYLISRAYETAKNRLILLDNEVTRAHPRARWDLPTLSEAPSSRTVPAPSPNLLSTCCELCVRTGRTQCR